MIVIPGVSGSALGLPIEPDVLPSHMAWSAPNAPVRTFEFGSDDVKYTLHRKVGKGAFGTVNVYRQTDRPDLPQDLAVKEFKTHNDSTRDEMRLVSIRDGGRRNGALDAAFKAMQAVMMPATFPFGSSAIIMRRGVDLRKVIGDPDMVPEEQVFDVCANIAIATYVLQLELMQGGLVYTDVKPENLALVRTHDDAVALVFIDYGGLCSIASAQPIVKRCAATYPSPPHFEQVYDARTTEAAQADAMYWAAMTFIMLLLLRATKSGDARASQLLGEVYGTLGGDSATHHARDAMLTRLQKLIQTSVPDRRGTALASWLSWEVADRMTATEVIAAVGGHLKLLSSQHRLCGRQLGPTPPDPAEVVRNQAKDHASKMRMFAAQQAADAAAAAEEFRRKNHWQIEHKIKTDGPTAATLDWIEKHYGPELRAQAIVRAQELEAVREVRARNAKVRAIVEQFDASVPVDTVIDAVRREPWVTAKDVQYARAHARKLRKT